MDDPIQVLVVDDDPDVAELVATRLESELAQVDPVTVTAASAALEVVEDGSIDCIVSDYALGSTTGLELLERVREREPGLPFVLFTGRGSEEIASEAIGAGVTYYLQKGAGAEQFPLLANQISNAVEQFRTETALRERDRQHRRTLAALHETTRELMRADSTEKVYRTVVRTGADVLAAGHVACYSFVPAAGHLELVEQTPSDWDGQAVIDRDGGMAWEAFSSGETLVADGEAVVPLGTHGVLVTGGDVTETRLELLAILAANTETALDRAEREHLLREHDRALTRKNEELTRLNHVNEIVREINRSVTGATSRDAIEEAVCEHLAATDRYQCAWIAGSDTDPPRPRAWAGVDASYVDTIRADGDTAPEVGVIHDTLGSGSPVVVTNVLEDADWADRRREAITMGIQTVLAVPVVGGERRFGVLLVYMAGADAIDEAERTVLAELAEMVGYAIRSVERTRSMVTDSRLEIELQLPDPRFILTEVATAAGEAVDLQGVVDRGEAGPVLFVRVDEDPSDSLAELASVREAVDRVSTLSEGESGSIVEVTAVSVPLLEVLAEYDARIVEAMATSEGTSLTLSLPSAVDPRSMIEAIERLHEGTELVARRENVTRPPVRGLDTHLESELTAKQREALQAAYYGGYFEWPRDSTGEDLAETLEVASPTYHYHLRAAQRKLVGTAFDGTYN